MHLIMIYTKSLLSAFALLMSVLVVAPLRATLTPSDGMFVRSTSANLGSIVSGQTVLFDLVRVYRADAEITLINNDTNQPVAQFLKTWNYGSDSANATGGGATGGLPINVSMQNNSDYDMIVLDGVPEGNYRVNMDVLAPDYSPDTQESDYGYFDSYGDFGYGFIGIDMGSQYQSSAASDIMVLTE